MSCSTEDSQRTPSEAMEKAGSSTKMGAETGDATLVVERLRTSDAQTVEPLLETLKGAPALVAEVTGCLTDSLDQASLAALKRLVSSRHRDLALAAARALGDCRCQAAGEAITKVLAQEQVDKAVAKELRRSLHRLRSAGLLAPADVWPQKSPQKATNSQALSPFAALASYFDALGDRILHYLAIFPGGAVQFMSLFVNDTVGIKECEVSRISRRQWGLTKKELLATDMVYAEIDPGYCRQLIWEYAERNQQSGTLLPQEFVLARPWLGQGEEHLICPVYTYLPVEEISAQIPLLLPGSEALLQTEGKAVWSFPPEPLAEAARKLQERQKSPIWLNKWAEAEQEERIWTETLDNIMAGDFRQIFIRRLEETAYIAYLTGKEKESRLVLATAVALREGKKRLLDIPLLAIMLNRGLDGLLNNNQPRRNSDYYHSAIYSSVLDITQSPDRRRP